MIYEKIDYLLSKKQINRKQMCIETDIPYSTYSNMCARKSESISMKAIVKISKYFNVTVDYLMRDDIPLEPILYENSKIQELTNQELPQDKKELLNNYDKLNNQGKEKAIERVEELTQIQKYTLKENTDTEFSDELSITELDEIKLFDLPVSAGTGTQLLDDVSYELITIDRRFYPKVDFALRVSGDSMEPRFYTGDIIYIESTNDVPNGKIGIFYYNDESYLKKIKKENGKIYLISLNKKYPPIEVTNDSFKAVGIVL